MKFLASILLTLFFSNVVLSQSDPAVSSYMRYEEVPIDLSNGVPDVTVPFVNLPTRSKDIPLNVNLKYHVLNGIGVDAQAGDCGMGWNLFAGGVISRTLIGTKDTYSFTSTNPSNVLQSDDIYQFNFMGYFGRFILMKKPDGTLGIKVLKQKESRLVLTFQYDSSYEITAFNFFDEKGYKYIFNVLNNNDGYNSAYYLSSVVDNNNKELLHFNYQTCFTPAVVGVSVSRTYNKLSEIISNGFGKISLTYSIGSNCGNPQLTELLLSDSRNNALRKLKLFKAGSRINKIQISDPSETHKEIYKFYYNTWDYPHYGHAVDSFGYRTTPSCGNFNSTIGIPSTTDCKAGVLVKMVLPTGGSIVYDYESNTYSSYVKGSDNIWHLDLSPTPYYESLVTPLIPENFLPTDYAGVYPFNFTNTNSTYSFTITGSDNKELYFRLEGEEYYLPFVPHPTLEDPNPQPLPRYPTFTLTRTSGITYNFPHFGESGYYMDNTSGFCLGQKISLTPGNYTITIHSDNNQYNFGTLEIKTLELNPNPRKWFYGGGVRIKQIGFFNNDAPSTYYNSNYYTTLYNSEGYSPVKEKKFDYNFFGTSYSSGYLANTDFRIINQDDSELSYPKKYFGGYKNVTVTDSQNNGREEYVFKDSLDPFDTEAPNSNVFFEDNKRGLLLSKKTYDSNNNLVSSIDMNYDFDDPEAIGGLSSNYLFTTGYPSSVSNLLSIGKLTQKTTKKYFGSQVNSVTEFFSYDSTNFQLKEHNSTNSLGENLKTEYYFDINNSPYSQNRISEPSQTKMYRAGSLISTNKVNYTTLYGNFSYLPRTIEYAKGNGSLEVKKRYNLYDEYSNLLEEQDENGIITSYIMGYNNSVVVAKLKNISYSNIPSNLISAIQTVTSDTSSATEAQIMSALDALRTSSDSNMQKAMITTYSYRPLVGISTVTDAKGDKFFYEYDDLGKLIRVRDRDNNILSETQYNLFLQN